LATKRWELESTLAELHVRLTSAKEIYTTLSERALPEARKAVNVAEEGYERARYSFQELSLAQQQLIQIKYAILEAATEYHLTFLELERLTGQSMTSLASSP
jgi:cobalt-zinc-cadmium efflux system outer membrane protein